MLLLLLNHTPSSGGITGNASGVLGFTGAAIGAVAVSATASGTLALTGSSTGTLGFPSITGVVSGTLSVSGSAAGVVSTITLGDIPIAEAIEIIFNSEIAPGLTLRQAVLDARKTSKLALALSL